jgi:hypothetical protein
MSKFFELFITDGENRKAVDGIADDEYPLLKLRSGLELCLMTGEDDDGLAYIISYNELLTAEIAGCVDAKPSVVAVQAQSSE